MRIAVPTGGVTVEDEWMQTQESQLDEPFLSAIERENAGILKVCERLDWPVLLG